MELNTFNIVGQIQIEKVVPESFVRILNPSLAESSSGQPFILILLAYCKEKPGGSGGAQAGYWSRDAGSPPVEVAVCGRSSSPHFM